ncbi:MAG: glucosidase, partial [Verrucomicrobiota bacterium]|nr:glucosidase [Verrucomicrobiota bacterium]
MAKPQHSAFTPEDQRLAEDACREKNWKRWGPYLSERQWGVVREDYSADSDVWAYLTHEDARSRAYRWGEDGLLGFCDRECRLCFALALWNGRDPILKERLFGLSGPEGNHGEDVKECYFYLDATPTSSYARALYKYPQAAFPYEQLLAENRRRGRDEPEFELLDTHVFDGERYFDVFVEYAKAGVNDILIKITAANRGPEPARLHVLPTLWFRNTWSWGCKHEGCEVKPRLRQVADGRVECTHATLEKFFWEIAPDGNGQFAPLLFTENETNVQKLFGAPNVSSFVKDAFHDHVVSGRREAVDPQRTGTKAAAHRVLDLAPGQDVVWRLRLYAEAERPAHSAGSGQPEIFGKNFEDVFAARRSEADAFYARVLAGDLSRDEHHVARQAYAGLLWSKQFY